MNENIPDKTKSDLQNIVQSALLDLFDIDITEIAGEKKIFRFHNDTNELGKNLIWQSNVYEPFPIKSEGFEISGNGTSNRPKMTVSNVFGMITNLSAQYDDLIGGKVVRRRVLVDYLDAVNFKNGNPNADPTQEIVSNYYIERMVSLNSLLATFELALPCESDGSLIPARIITADNCAWVYRSVECSYTGGAVADEFDNPTSDITKDKCSRCLKGCKLRFGSNSILPFGGFPTSSRI